MAPEPRIELVAQGAAIVDVGGESTRPGATRPLVTDELARVVPVIAALAGDFGHALREGRQLRANGIGVVPEEYKDRAQVILRVLGDQQTKTVVAVNPSGLAREYRLTYRLGFRVESGSGIELYPATTIELMREISFNPQTPQEVLSKEQEDAMLIRDMQNDAAIQVMQRLSTIRVPPGTVLTAPKKPKSEVGKRSPDSTPTNTNAGLTTADGMQPLGAEQ